MPDLTFFQQPILMGLDVWEHAYYLDYRNDRAKFIDAFPNIANRDEIGKRLAAAEKGISFNQ